MIIDQIQIFTNNKINTFEINKENQQNINERVEYHKDSKHETMKKLF